MTNNSDQLPLPFDDVPKVLTSDNIVNQTMYYAGLRIPTLWNVLLEDWEAGLAYVGLAFERFEWDNERA